MTEEDLKRTMQACGGSIQTTVSSLTDNVLGTCTLFEEKQIGNDRYVYVFYIDTNSFELYFDESKFDGCFFTCVLAVLRYNFFTGCSKAKTCTLILRGGAEQFIEETERSLHDAIMIVRRAIKNDAVVAGQFSIIFLTLNRIVHFL